MTSRHLIRPAAPLPTMRIIGIVAAVGIVLASCGGGGDADIDVEPLTSTTTVEEIRGSDELFQEVESVDQAAESSEGSGDEPTGSAPTSSGPVTGGADAGSGDTDGSAPTDQPVTTPASGSIIQPVDGDDVCGRVQAVADALQAFGDAEAAAGSSERDERLRAGLDQAVAALTSNAAVAPSDVADDIALMIEGVELRARAELGTVALTPEQQELLDGDDLGDATRRFAAYAVDTCGIEVI